MTGRPTPIPRSRRFQPPGPSCSVEAQRKLRLLRTALDGRVKALTEASERVPTEWLRALRHKSGTGLDRARERIIGAMPEKPMLIGKRELIWRMLVPIDGRVIIEALAVGANGTGSFTRREFALAVNDHALLRLMDRTAFAADAIEATLEAHDALLKLQPDEGERMFALRDIRLPASTGVFLARTDPDDEFPLAVCGTWISADQLRPEQEAEVAAWNSLAAAKPPTIVKKRG